MADESSRFFSTQNIALDPEQIGFASQMQRIP